MPAVTVKGRIARAVSEVRKTLKRPLLRNRRNGPAGACTFDTLNNLIRCRNEVIDLGSTFKPSTFKTWSGHSSNDGSGLV